MSLLMYSDMRLLTLLVYDMFAFDELLKSVAKVLEVLSMRFIRSLDVLNMLLSM